MGLIENLLKRNDATGKCEGCRHFVKISETSLGCLKHDKLIMPNHIPYSYTNGGICKDWEYKDSIEEVAK